MNAKKDPHGPDEAKALLNGMHELIATKGKKVIRIDLRKGEADSDQIESLMIGPSGKLRAPTIRVGKKLLVGFDEEMYRDVFC